MKIIKSKLSKFSAITLLAIILVGCTNQEVTAVCTEYSTVYDNYNEENNTISFKDLKDVTIYYHEYKLGDETYFEFELLKQNQFNDYIAYSDALDGTLYSVEIYEPKNYDHVKYKGYLNDTLIEVESLMDCIEGGNYSEFVRDGIDFENQTIEIQSLRLLVASYIAHNFEVGEQIKNTRL